MGDIRKLASIQRVWQIEPIEGADRIELVSVLGWKCVVKKSEFSVGDLGVYFEVDSFLPMRPEFEFLRNTSYRKSDLLGEGYRLKTQRFKGVLSQGLLLPLSMFPEIPKDVSIGDDVTELLGVKKWEIEERASTGGTIIGTLPSCIPHTDEIRIQSMPELLKEFSGCFYYISTKMDGSSHSVAWDNGEYHVTGHNYEYADDGKSSFYEYIKKRLPADRMQSYCGRHRIKSLVIQGELCAPGIQNNRLKLAKPTWYVFNVIIDGERVGLYKMLYVCADLGLDNVPIEERGRNLPEQLSVDGLIERAKGVYKFGCQKEGIVVRPLVPKWSELLNAPLSFKVLNNDYLLKWSD